MYVGKCIERSVHRGYDNIVFSYPTSTAGRFAIENVRVYDAVRSHFGLSGAIFELIKLLGGN
jgi:hypothetical protein